MASSQGSFPCQKEGNHGGGGGRNTNGQFPQTPPSLSQMEGQKLALAESGVLLLPLLPSAPRAGYAMGHTGACELLSFVAGQSRDQNPVASLVRLSGCFIRRTEALLFQPMADVEKSHALV